MNKILLIILILISGSIKAQYLPVHTSDPVYDFLFELNNENLININTAVLPYSHKEIAAWLGEVESNKLNRRQLKDLEFYRRAFNNRKYEKNSRKSYLLKSKPGSRFHFYHYSDSLFTFTLNPVYGGNYYLNKNDSAYHWWNGATASATLGKWAFYGRLRDNHESQHLTQPDFMNQNYGGSNFKTFSDGKVDYWEYRGGVSYDFDIGNIGLYKDHFAWGNNYNGSNIFSGRTPSFTNLAFNIQPAKWFEYRYVHGWLVSELVDSTRSFNVYNNYGVDYREVYHKKYLAANFFTFKPFKNLKLSVGNSIIYDYENPHIAYFIPAIFYKAVDHHLSSGIDNMNEQLFFDFSMNFFPKTHIYGTLFIDELAVGRIFNPDEYNFISSKAGIRFENIIPNLYAGAEYTSTNALCFQHFVPTTTFESNRFNLGHYLEDNAKELYLYAGIRPARATSLHVSYTSAKKGPDHTFLGTEPRIYIDPLDPPVWESDKLSIQFTWQIIHDLFFRLSFVQSNIRGEEDYLLKYTPEMYHGKVNRFSFGLNYGF